MVDKIIPESELVTLKKGEMFFAKEGYIVINTIIFENYKIKEIAKIEDYKNYMGKKEATK